MKEAKQPKMRNGYFVTFEGLDGVGKSACLKKLFLLLKKRFPKQEILLTQEPGGTALGRVIQNLTQKLSGEETSGTTEVLLYAADRRHHLETTVWPALKRNAIVLCDRYVDSSVAYQGYGYKMVSFVTQINALVTKCTTPDLTVFFSLPTKIRETRLAKRGKKDKMENADQDFYNRVAVGYQKIVALNPNRTKVVEACKPLVMVVQEVFAIVEKHILKKLNKC